MTMTQTYTPTATSELSPSAMPNGVPATTDAPPHSPRAQAACDSVRTMTDRTATKAEGAIESTRRATNGALDSLHAGVESLRESVPNSFDRNASRVEDIARRGIDRARSTSATVRTECAKAGTATRGYIQHEPVKSVLMAAAAGAAIAGLITWMGRNRTPR
jgi:ElaB/YqjD/DUF883 family membrane-anchored ribosome-binding protein